MWDKLPACQIVVRDSFQLVKSLKLSSVKVSRKHLLLLTTEPTGASPGFVASPQAATGASARRLTMNQQSGPKSAASHRESY
jgi:hypothetical protein